MTSLSTYQDRAREVIRKYRDEVDLNRDRYSAGGEDNYNAIEDQALSELASIVEEEIVKAKQKLAMCIDDKTFLEEHKFANVLEYDTKFSRPSRAIYHNRQWEAERDGMNILANVGLEIAKEEQRDQLSNRSNDNG